MIKTRKSMENKKKRKGDKEREREMNYRGECEEKTVRTNDRKREI